MLPSRGDVADESFLPAFLQSVVARRDISCEKLGHSVEDSCSIAKFFKASVECLQSCQKKALLYQTWWGQPGGHSSNQLKAIMIRGRRQRPPGTFCDYGYRMQGSVVLGPPFLHP